MGEKYADIKFSKEEKRTMKAEENIKDVLEDESFFSSRK